MITEISPQTPKVKPIELLQLATGSSGQWIARQKLVRCFCCTGAKQRIIGVPVRDFEGFCMSGGSRCGSPVCFGGFEGVQEPNR